MTDETHGMDQLLDAALEDAAGVDRTELSLEARTLLEAADLLWEFAHGAPALENDPVAAMLGLVPDVGAGLDTKSLTRLRKRSGLKVAELARRLQVRGWHVDGSDVFRWETRSAAEVPPALIRAVADELHCSYELLINKHPLTVPPAIAGVLESPRYRKLVERWSQLTRAPIAASESTLRSRMLSTVHRGSAPSEEQILESLEALVDELEGAGDGRP